MNIFRRIIGLLFLILPFLPTALLFEKKRIKGAEASFGPYQWFLGVLIVFFIAYILSLLPFDKYLKNFTSKIKSDLEQQSSRLFAFCIFTAFLFLNLCAYFCFRHRPHLVDSIVQLFQAKIFAAGLLKAPSLKYPEFFVTHHMLFDQSGWYSQYPPGHQALLSIGVLLGTPWLVNILLTTISIIFAYKIAKKTYGNKHANISLILAAYCPFLIFMGADYMNHVPTLTCIILFTYFYICWEEKQKAKDLIFAGIAIGFAFLIRPLTALGMGIPFGLFAIFFAIRNKLFLHLIFAALSSAVFIAINFIYNKLMFGDPFLPGYIKLWGKGHDLGFHESPWGESHTPLAGIRNELADVFLLNEYLYEWPIPVLSLIGLYLLFTKELKRNEKLFLSSFLMLPATYFFYWHRDAFLGPRFMYEGVIFLIFLSSSALIKISQFLENKKIGLAGILPQTLASSVFAWGLILCIVYSLSMGIPAKFTIYASSLNSLKLDITKRAQAEKINKALIFIKVSWGVRLLSELRAFGISAPLTQNAYTKVDHCRLQEALDLAKASNWSSDQLSGEIENLIKKKMPIKNFVKHTDHSLKLTSIEELSQRCKNELAYDTSSKFAVYSGHLTANSPKFDGDYIIAMDLRNKNKLLMEQFPQYPAYIYLPDRFVKVP